MRDELVLLWGVDSGRALPSLSPVSSSAWRGGTTVPVVDPLWAAGLSDREQGVSHLRRCIAQGVPTSHLPAEGQVSTRAGVGAGVRGGTTGKVVGAESVSGTWTCVCCPEWEARDLDLSPRLTVGEGPHCPAHPATTTKIQL